MNLKEQRKNLFLTFIEEKEGIELIKLFQLTEEIQTTWKEFHHLIRNQVKYFYKTERIKEIKVVKKDNKNFLILRLHTCDYLVIDLETKRVVKKAEILDWDSTFFRQTFHESAKKNKSPLFFNTCKNPEQILFVYLTKEKIFTLPTSIYYEVDSKTNSYFYIDLIGNYTHFGFYEGNIKAQYFLNCDFHFVNNRSAIRFLGKTKVNELEEMIPNMLIPYEKIPEEILETESFIRERKIKI